jgi:multidrug resistance efflux pump
MPTFLTSLASSVSASVRKLWARYRSYSARTQLILGVIALIIIVTILVTLRGGSAATTATAQPTVMLQSISSFGDTTNGVSSLGTVKSVSQADILAQSGGTVTAVNARLGQTVPAGFVIASLDSAAASAAVLSAQGSYDAALAGQKSAVQQSQGSVEAVRNTYRSAYTSLQAALTNNVDLVFGDNTPIGPRLLINAGTSGDDFSRQRRDIDDLMQNWQASLATVNTADPLTLLTNAQQWADTVSTFITNLNALAIKQGSDATAAQLAGLASAQGTANSVESSIITARDSYNAKQAAAAANGSKGDVTSADASVEIALGGLRSAQAAYEKTVVRAPIAGTINYMPLTVGASVTIGQRVATVARNNALEVVMHVSQHDSQRLTVGSKVTIEGTTQGVVTSIAPALDPTTKQVEVDIAVMGTTDLVNGQSVQVALPTLPSETNAKPATTVSTASTTASSTAATYSVQLPLTAVKLLPSERDIFTVENGRLVAHAVQIGDVIGDRIVVTTDLPAETLVVADARGLSAGDAVSVASSSPAS